jgi:hypothetical protein
VSSRNLELQLRKLALEAIASLVQPVFILPLFVKLFSKFGDIERATSITTGSHLFCEQHWFNHDKITLKQFKTEYWMISWFDQNKKNVHWGWNDAIETMI